MKRIAAAAVAAVAIAASGAAGAQEAGNIAGVVATELGAFGQGIGRGASGSDDIYIHAQGRAKLPDALTAAWQGHTPAFVATAEGKAPSAVEAVRKRDAKIERLRAAAAKLGGEIQVGESTLVVEGNGGGEPGGGGPMVDSATEAAPAKPAPFLAHATIRFVAPDPAKLPALLDALRAAGADDLRPDVDAGNYVRRYYESWSYEATAKVDEATWAQAGADAVRAATVQARALAEGAHRDLGPVNQITYLIRTTDGKQAYVALVVRFHLGAAH
jgi:hypothetical protein